MQVHVISFIELITSWSLHVEQNLLHSRMYGCPDLNSEKLFAFFRSYNNFLSQCCTNCIMNSVVFWVLIQRYHKAGRKKNGFFQLFWSSCRNQRLVEQTEETRWGREQGEDSEISCRWGLINSTKAEGGYNDSRTNYDKVPMVMSCPSKSS